MAVDTDRKRTPIGLQVTRQVIDLTERGTGTLAPIGAQPPRRNTDEDDEIPKRQRNDADRRLDQAKKARWRPDSPDRILLTCSCSEPRLSIVGTRLDVSHDRA